MSTFPLFVTLTVALLAAPTVADEGVQAPQKLYLPHSMRAEGRITLTYTDSSGTNQHQLAFSELIDEKQKQSKISIGYVSHMPTVYHIRDNRTLRVDEQGRCSALDTEKPAFVKEIAWFVDLLYNRGELQNFLRDLPYQLGPSGLVWLLMNGQTTSKPTYEGNTYYRNLDCYISVVKFKRAKCEDVRLEMYVPHQNFFNDTKIPMFSLKETANSRAWKADTTERTEYTTSFTIDYFNIVPLNKLNQAQQEQLAEEFTLPLASGCSEFLSGMLIGSGIDGSYMAEYFQASLNSYVKVAFDNNYKLYRKETHQGGVTVTDITRELVYHTDSPENKQLNLLSCSVTDIQDPKLGPSTRPYKDAHTANVYELSGFHMFSWLGFGRVRNMPCAIFETILKEPPSYFGLNSESKPRRLDDKYDYIIQYHLLRTSQNFDAPADTDFWPLRIALYRRLIETGAVDQLDQLDMLDYHLGLIGGDTKASELFAMPDCFQDEEGLVRLELAFRINQYEMPAYRALVVHNKFKLELDILNKLMDLLGLSRMHVIEYELRFRPSNVVALMTIGDRRELSQLAYLGAGDLAAPGYYESTQMVLGGLDEQSCLSVASLVAEISAVIYCPKWLEIRQDSKCTAVYKQPAPAIKLLERNQTVVHSCQVYRFKQVREPSPVTANWKDWRQRLREFKFEFIGETPKGKDVPFYAQVEEVDVSRSQVQLMEINHYRYLAQESPTTSGERGQQAPSGEPNQTGKLVREYNSINYESAADCSKVCDLDVACKSYSFCLEPEPSCLLASLDIKASNVDQQLQHISRLDQDLRATVWADLATKRTGYTIKMAPTCNIYERDYLGAYTETDEVVKLDPALKDTYRTEETASACARLSVELEEREPGNHKTMFVYCPSSSTCIMDDFLFRKLRADQTTPTVVKQREREDKIEPLVQPDDELTCQVYRRKYQTYFRLSGDEMLGQDDGQTRLELERVDSVEECAHACWVRFGQVCASFDFCSPSDCIINMVPNEGMPNLADHQTNKSGERRNGCLHYERDLRLDKLRQEHLIGSHQILLGDQDPSESSSSITFGGLVMNAILLCLLVSSFMLGLTMSQKVEGRLGQPNLSSLHESFSAGPAGFARRASRAFGSSFKFSRFANETSSVEQMETNGQTNGIDEYRDFPMQEIKREDVIKEEEEEELDQSSASEPGDDQSSGSGGHQSSPVEVDAATREIDVPNLMEI